MINFATWKNVEKWGKNHPVFLVIVAFLIGAAPSGTIGYNTGFYAGTVTAEDTWRATLNRRVDFAVKDQFSSKCGEIVASVNNTCQSQIRSLQSAIRTKDEEISTRDVLIERLKVRSDVLDLHDNFARSANDILSAIQKSRETQDRAGEQAAQKRVELLLQDMTRINQLFSEWAGLFNSVATNLTTRLRNGEQIGVDELVAFLRGFVADNERKRKVIQTEAESAARIKGTKY